MNCPHCGYEHGHYSNVNIGEWIEGKEGAFYKLERKFVRESSHDHDEVRCYACPKCRKTFVEE